MDFRLVKPSALLNARHAPDALIVLLPKDGLAADDPCAPLLSGVAAEDLPGKPGRLLQLYQPAPRGPRRVVLAAVGPGNLRDVRAAVTAAVSALKGSTVRRLALHIGGLAEGQATSLRVAMQAVADTAYTYTATKPGAEAWDLREVVMAADGAKTVEAAYRSALALIQGVALAREWGNRPANHATPRHLADAARSLAKRGPVTCEVLDAPAIRRLRMGAFLAVAQGSAEPPRFIVLRYRGAAARRAPVVLVGKGITFDTGGISIKPAPEMDEMKFDMCGAASVLGVFQALAVARPAVNVVGLIPACENMPSGTAVKPGDVVTSMSGQTIEILNTDAEGRLILCDALTYAARFKPAAVIDIATLTGACVIALGAVRSGLFATDDALAQALADAGDAALDPCWRMPLDDDYAEGLKTNFADVANVAGRAAGAVTAAKFLQRFAGSAPWAHLDIAGTAWKGGATTKGSTGRPVPLLFEYLCRQVATPN